MAENKAETILVAVRSDDMVKVGLPPKHRLDSFEARAKECGRVPGCRRMFFSPADEMFCIRNSDLYAGPMPSGKVSDWFTTAKRVGQQEWGGFKLLCFDPKGDLYAVSHEGDLYKGPKPDNENRPWRYGQATIIGRGGWEILEAMFFDPEGSLYAVTNYNTLVKGPAPENSYNWLVNSKTVGRDYWCKLTHFMAIGPQGDLWCIDKHNGNVYKGAPPTSEDSVYLNYAEYLGWNYHEFKCYAFAKDKTIQEFISFEFKPEEGKRVSEKHIVIAEKIYDNRNSSSNLKHTFIFEKKMKQSSSFTKEHGFTTSIEAKTSFKAGMPVIGETELEITVNTTTSHRWEYNDTNETEITVSSSTDMDIEPGKAVKVKASIVAAELEVPYVAQVVTLFGFKTSIKGKWCGVTHYNLRIIQQDYTK